MIDPKKNSAQSEAVEEADSERPGKSDERQGEATKNNITSYASQ